MKNDIESIFTFIIELEKLKAVRRRSRTLAEDRYENSAEHSWHAALLALSLSPYSSRPVDVCKVIKMLLIHDVVEIDTGDKFVYGDNHDDYDNEHTAAERIFGLLPDDIGGEYLTLWEAFERGDTPEAVFARAMDRLIPVLLNLFNNGQSWVENSISLSQVLEKNGIIAEASPELFAIVKEKLLAAKAKGHLK